MHMDQLNLPEFAIRIKKEDEASLVYDQIRKKYVVLTPEEWVRQHFINYLISHLGYPRALINVEQGLKYNSLQKRSDIIVYSRDGEPLVLVECKAARYNLDQKVMEQGLMYNRTIGARYIIITNGVESACMQIDVEASKVEFLKEVPGYDEL
jgi:hypothetical protein